MKCLHCGWCCFMYDVIIIHPIYATPKFKMEMLSKDENQHIAKHKPNGKTCPHIEIRDDLYFCKIHRRHWYKKTPCFQHGQMESDPSDPCRMGEYVLKNQKMKDKLLQIVKEGL